MTSLSDEDRAQLVNRYNARFAQHGFDARTLNLGDPRKYSCQQEIHAAIAPLEGATILDIGCGLANFYEFIRPRHGNIRYIGYDIVESFIKANQIRYPDAQFRLFDISRDPIIDSFDYAVMCQVFNNKYEDADNVAVIRAALSKVFVAAERGVSVDMLSTYVSYRDKNLFYYSPEEMFSFSKGLTPYVSLLHGYLDHHFTIQLFKKPMQP